MVTESMRVVVINRRPAYWRSRRPDENLFIECPLLAALVASDTPIEVALESVELFEGIGKGG
jgi:hypothetical protein